MAGGLWEGINTDELESQGLGMLADKVRKYQAGRGKLGTNYQRVLSGLGRAYSYKGPFSMNDIYNSGRAIQNVGAANIFDTKEGATSAAAASGAIDTGGFGKYLARTTGAIQQGVNEDVTSDYSGKIAENERAKFDRIQTATNAWDMWKQIRDERRRREAAAAAAEEAEGGQPSQWWGIGSGVLNTVGDVLMSKGG